MNALQRVQKAQELLKTLPTGSIVGLFQEWLRANEKWLSHEDLLDLSELTQSLFNRRVIKRLNDLPSTCICE